MHCAETVYIFGADTTVPGGNPNAENVDSVLSRAMQCRALMLTGNVRFGENVIFVINSSTQKVYYLTNGGY